MANAARVHAVERGKDPRALPLFAFGGAGPVHACGVAQALGVPSARRPAGGRRAVGDRLPDRAAGVRLRALGARPLEDLTWADVDARFAEMEAEGLALLAARESAAERSAIAASPTCATRARATRSASPCPAGGSRLPRLAAARVRRGVPRAVRAARPARCRSRQSTGASSRAARDPRSSCTRTPRPPRVRRSRAAGRSGSRSGRLRRHRVHDRYAIGPARTSPARRSSRSGSRRS